MFSALEALQFLWVRFRVVSSNFELYGRSGLLSWEPLGGYLVGGQSTPCFFILDMHKQINCRCTGYNCSRKSQPKQPNAKIRTKNKLTSGIRQNTNETKYSYGCSTVEVSRQTARFCRDNCLLRRCREPSPAPLAGDGGRAR